MSVASRFDLDTACWLAIVPYLLVDTANGFLVQGLGVDLKVSLLYKGILLALLFVRVAQWRPAVAVGVLAVSLLFLVRPTWQLFDGEFGAASTDLPIAIRVLLIPLLLAFAVRAALQDQKRLTRNASLTLAVSYWTIIGNVLIGLIGFGFPTYPSTGIGYKGFFVAGNEVSALLIVTAGYTLFRTWMTQGLRTYLFYASLSVGVAILLATKAAVAAAVLMTVAIPLATSRTQRPSIRLIVGFAVAIGAGGIATYFARETIIASALGQRLQFIYERLGIVELVFSGRLAFVQRYLMTLREVEGVGVALFGIGSTGLLGFGPPTVEIDPVDFAALFGLPVAAVCLGAAAYSVWWPVVNLRERPYAPVLAIVNSLLFVLACTAGHVWSSGMLPVAWMMLMALGLSKTAPREVG